MAQTSPPTIRTLPIAREEIKVVDGLFTRHEIVAFFEALRMMNYSLSDYDTEATAHIRHWKREFEPERAVQTVIPGRIHELVKDTYPHKHFAPPRIHANLHMYGDLQNTHTDVHPENDGITAVYFANAHWRENWWGEILFFDGDEALYAVTPRAGRLVMFPGYIRHRAGVPSRLCFEPRITVAFKYGSMTNNQESTS